MKLFRDGSTWQSRVVQLARSVQDFLSAPVGRYVSGRSFIIWAQTPSRLGSAYFGRPDASDFEALRALFALHLNPHLQPPFDAICDGRDLTDIDPSAFALLGEYMTPQWSEIATRVRKLAIVRPRGMPGATLAGVFHETVRPHVDAGLFDDRAPALDWLGLDAGARAEVDAAIAAYDGAPPLLRRLREHLAKHLRAAALEESAQALALSARSLQRSLKEHGTSFRGELDLARVRAAERMLADTELKIDAIAREIGCTPSTFYELFRRATGRSPADFRSGRR
jgi:AraC-like DNA-binding protein